MSLERTLKPDRNLTGALVPLSMLPIFGITSFVFGIQTGMYTLSVLAGIFALFYLLTFFRTGNYPHLFVFTYCVFTALILVWLGNQAGMGAAKTEILEFSLAYFSGLLFFGAIIIYLVLTRKLKWRGREIFELAGEQVEETNNGYTHRPRPVGKMDFSPEEIRGFARFVARSLIALPYSTSRNITLVPVKMGDEYSRLLGLSGDYREATWVSFDFDGEVSVHISQKDYLDYRQPLSFDQLCVSFGQVFIDFFELYKIGAGERVIDRMDDLKIAVFS